MHLGCSALSGTVTRVAPLSGTVTQTVPRENLQIGFFSASFVPTGASPIQCNSRLTRQQAIEIKSDMFTKHPNIYFRWLRMQCSFIKDLATYYTVNEQSAPDVLAAAVEQLVPALEWSAATVASTAA
ncbi:hypothetical protein F2Q68_00004171 [Brassica cretica]|uniref:Uncharacterized protein n=1 Tax=Brassica cretica TaxID=69181 RepID=A0A8S9JA12_BRACR|nr:hypothetical protein F2Q68_00004171 [Brassica cretica]